MEKNKTNNSKANIVTAYSFRRGRWIIFIYIKEKNKIIKEVLNEHILDFNGEMFERKMKKFSQKVVKYGITQNEIEDAILEEVKWRKVKPPKYLL